MIHLHSIDEQPEHLIHFLILVLEAIGFFFGVHFELWVQIVLLE